MIPEDYEPLKGDEVVFKDPESGAIREGWIVDTMGNQGSGRLIRVNIHGGGMKWAGEIAIINVKQGLHKDAMD